MKKNATTQKSRDNRSNQLNPNNSLYRKSRENHSTKMTVKLNNTYDWDEDSFGDDWVFNDN